jgi:hypothetical protein
MMPISGLIGARRSDDWHLLPLPTDGSFGKIVRTQSFSIVVRLGCLRRNVRRNVISLWYQSAHVDAKLSVADNKRTIRCPLATENLKHLSPPKGYE